MHECSSFVEDTTGSATHACMRACAAQGHACVAFHLCSICTAPEKLQRRRLHQRGSRIGGEIAEGRLAQRGDARQGEGRGDPGGGGGARVGQAEGVVQAGPAVAISRLRGGGVEG
jgi:hypothetical protein